MTIEQLATLHAALGVTNIADLAAAVEQQAVQRVPGLDAAIERAVIDALSGLRAAIQRIPLGLAMAIADPILEHLRSFAGIEWVLPVGWLRRGQDTVGDIELIAAAVDPEAAIEALQDFSGVVRPLQRNSRRLYLLLDRSQVGIRFPEPAKAGAMLLHLTGSAAHFGQLPTRAAERGWRLDPEGLHAPDGALKMAATEEEIYAPLDLPFIPPEIRNGDDELSVAGRGGYRRSSRAATFEATSTCTRCGATAGIRSRRWSRRAAVLGTSISRSRTTRRMPRRHASCPSTPPSARPTRSPPCASSSPTSPFFTGERSI